MVLFAVSITKNVFRSLIAAGLLGFAATFLFNATISRALDDTALNRSSLQLESSFPSESASTYLVFPTEFYFDDQQCIYVIDQNQSNVQKFSFSGTPSGTIGRRGQGPGEFEMPHAFYYLGNQLFVVDQGNRRVQILDTNGNYLNSFKLFRLIQNVACWKDIIIGQEIFNNNEIDEFRLLSVFNQTGKKENSFGASINDFIGISGLPPEASRIRLKLYKDKLYAMFQYYPLIREYSIEGKLLGTLDLSKKDYKRLIPGNYDLSKILASPNYTNMKYLFLAFDISEKGIFVCVYKDDIEIHQYDFQGKPINEFVYKHHNDDNFYVQDIKLALLGGVQKLFVLTYLPLPKIMIFNFDKTSPGVIN